MSKKDKTLELLNSVSLLSFLFCLFYLSWNIWPFRWPLFYNCVWNSSMCKIERTKEFQIWEKVTLGNEYNMKISWKSFPFFVGVFLSSTYLSFYHSFSLLILFFLKFHCSNCSLSKSVHWWKDHAVVGEIGGWTKSNWDKGEKN